MSTAPTPRQELSYAIQTWEGLFQDQPQDKANWVNGVCVGTMRGVTPAVLAAHRGIPVASVTKDMMKTVTLEEAADIGVDRFYKGTGLDLLPWGPATAALVDIGWGSGPRQAILFAQRLSGAKDDGRVGAETIECYTNWVAKVGWEEATRAVYKMRIAFYDLIIQRNPQWEIYRIGWSRRAASMLPGTTWWKPWASAAVPAVVQNSGVARDDQPVTQAPAPVTKSRTAAGTAAGGLAVILLGITETLKAASDQIKEAAQFEGPIQWALIGCALVGTGYALYRLVQDRKAPL